MLEGFICLAVLREGSTLGANALNVPVTGTMVCAKAASAVSIALKNIAVLTSDLAFGAVNEPINLSAVVAEGEGGYHSTGARR